MSQNVFPPLALTDWRPTRDTLHGYARVLGAIRGAHSPMQKHWWHVSLRVEAHDLTTLRIPRPHAGFELRLDLSEHRLTVAVDNASALQIAIEGQSPAVLGRQIQSALEKANVRLLPDIELGDDAANGIYDRTSAERYCRALTRIDATLKRLKKSLGPDTSPVQLWPHHFDLAMVWFSGNRVPGVDPRNEESSEEQMNFGFATGDDGFPDPYFYVTCHPVPAEFTQATLPPDAFWHTRGWTGAVMPYETLVHADHPDEMLFDFLLRVQEAGARFMLTPY